MGPRSAGLADPPRPHQPDRGPLRGGPGLDRSDRVPRTAPPPAGTCGRALASPARARRQRHRARGGRAAHAGRGAAAPGAETPPPGRNPAGRGGRGRVGGAALDGGTGRARLAWPASPCATGTPLAVAHPASRLPDRLRPHRRAAPPAPRLRRGARDRARPDPNRRPADQGRAGAPRARPRCCPGIQGRSLPDPVRGARVAARRRRKARGCCPWRRPSGPRGGAPRGGRTGARAGRRSGDPAPGRGDPWRIGLEARRGAGGRARGRPARFPGHGQPEGDRRRHHQRHLRPGHGSGAGPAAHPRRVRFRRCARSRAAQGLRGLARRRAGRPGRGGGEGRPDRLPAQHGRR